MIKLDKYSAESSRIISSKKVVVVEKTISQQEH